MNKYRWPDVNTSDTWVRHCHPLILTSWWGLRNWFQTGGHDSVLTLDPGLASYLGVTRERKYAMGNK